MPLREEFEPAPESVPERKGFRGFWQIMMSDFLEVVKLNLIFIAACLPVVTIPLAVYALNHVDRRIIRGQEVSCWADFKAGFRCWRQGYGAFFMVALPLGLGALGGWFYLSRAGESPLLYAPFLVCSTFLLVAMLCSDHLYALLDLGLSFREAVKKSLILGLGRPLRAFLAALCFYGLTAAGILALPISGMYVLFLGFTLPHLLGSYLIRTVLALLEEPPEGPEAH